MLTAVSIASLAMSLGCFALYLLTALRPGWPVAGPRALDDVQPHSAVGDGAKLAEAVAKLVEALGKAGPQALSLIGAIVFMIFALLAARG